MSEWLHRYRHIAEAVPILALAFGLAFLAPREAPAQQDAESFFKQNCAACHTIGGGKLLGPDLKGVTQVRDHEWLEKWLLNPQAVIDSGDAYAVNLKQEYGGMVMPSVPGMTPQMAEALLNFIAARSGVPAPPAAPAESAPFKPEQAAEGRAIFLGKQRLHASGPSCISCHSVKSAAGPLGGGQLGPDLTLVYQRLNGRRALEAWLSNPPSATMKPIFARHPLQPAEISALTAFFEQTSKEAGVANAGTYRLRLVLLGLGGAAVGLIILGLVWKRRIRGVRRALVEGRLGI